ncbi:MAG TPA: CoB--CoM heterodisulfide reductase iron-sulfur subunit A family protein [Syntrophobacteria bacterium]|nr:CoB--CoM heterodisulfide reductase iron-sulfur subunit A family protein [Syntrophobacteria bacterium]
MVDATEGKGKQAERKVGVYVCHCGGNISDEVDVQKVCDAVGKIPGVVVARDAVFMCSGPGQELIMEDLRKGAVDRVVIASCAPSLHEQTFRNALARAGANPYVYEHANIREHVSWVHHGHTATDKAIRLVAAATAKAKQLEALEPIRVEAKRHATVIGGGMAGMRAALDLAQRGIPAALVEKSPFLGGRAAQLDRVAPTDEKAADLVSAIASEVLKETRITVYTCARVVGFEGYVGDFTLKVRRTPSLSAEDQEKLDEVSQAGLRVGAYIPMVGAYPAAVPEAEEEFAVETGVVVLATGFKPYRPRAGEYGYGTFPEVITLPELIRSLATTEPEGELLTVDGKRIRSVAMIHCVGSRQIPGVHLEREDGSLNEYCSRTCCAATLHAANTIRDHYPGTRVYDLYRDIRTYGRGQEELYDRAARNRVLFLRFEATALPAVEKNDGSSGQPLRVRVKDTLTFGEEVMVPVDLVVLAVGMEPTVISDLVEMMKLPVGADRFLQEVHPKLRPVEVSVAGIMLAGTCQSPMDMGEACAGASSAAAKAASLLSRGFVELDPFVAEVDLDRCTGTGACVEACLRDGALRMVEVEVNGEQVRRAEVNPALCTGCGACVAVCPANAINVKGWTLKQYEAMVDMIAADQPEGTVSELQPGETRITNDQQ